MKPARRYLALHLPFWEAEHLRQSHPDLPADTPLALWARQGARRLLVAVDQAAAAAGLEPGQALADAEALLPALTVLPATPEASAAGLRDLALWAQRFTPLSAPLPPDGLLLDITGCDHLFGGEAALLAKTLTDLAALGLTAQGAVAGAAASAMALARVRRDAPIIAPGLEEKAVAPLALGTALRLPGGMVEDLARLGVRSIGDALRQPRAPLARRFGAPLLNALDAAAGHRAPPITPIAAPPELSVTRALPEPILTAEAIAALLDRLLAALCARLARAGLGARRLSLLAFRVDGTEQRLVIGTATPPIWRGFSPSRSPAWRRNLALSVLPCKPWRPTRWARKGRAPCPWAPRRARMGFWRSYWTGLAKGCAWPAPPHCRAIGRSGNGALPPRMKRPALPHPAGGHAPRRCCCAAGLKRCKSLPLPKAPPPRCTGADGSIR
jgi:protein ImuB